MQANILTHLGRGGWGVVCEGGMGVSGVLFIIKKKLKCSSLLYQATGVRFS